MTKFHRRAGACRMAARGSASLVVLAILAACGGGGGGAGGAAQESPASAPPSLSITADATATASAGASVKLHAAEENATGALTWALTGPGSLSATTGADILYIPPDAESLTQAATAIVTASAGASSKQIAIAVAVGSVAGQHWELRHALAPAWTSVAYGSGTFVAVGSSGAVRVSTNGQQWTPHDTDHHLWVSVAHGDAGWVAVALDGSVATSADGVRWSVASDALPGAGTAPSLTQVVFGNGLYVVGSRASGAWISADGRAWTATPHSFVALATGAGTFVGVEANGRTLASADAQAWDAVDPGPTPASIAYANGRFLADSAGQLASSVDGRTWVASGTTPYGRDPVLAAGDAFYQSASIDDGASLAGAIGESASGQQWTYRDQSAVGIASGLAKGADAIVVVSGDGSIGSGPDVDRLQPALARSNGHLMSAGYAGGRYVAVSASGDLLASTDGQAWAGTSLGAAAWPDAPKHFSGAALASAPSGRLVVAGIVPAGNEGVAPAVLYSDDGAAWNVATVPPDMFVNTFVNDGKRLLAFSNGGVYASQDGSTWALISRLFPQNGQWVTKAAHGRDLYVVVGRGGLAASSPDAVHWTVAPLVTDSAAASAPLDLTGLVYAGDRFVAVADNGHVATSTDGQHWSVSASATSRALGAIAVSTQGELVAVGEPGATETSVDAIHWTLRSSPGTATMRDVVFANGAFMAVGDDSAIDLSTH